MCKFWFSWAAISNEIVMRRMRDLRSMQVVFRYLFRVRCVVKSFALEIKFWPKQTRPFEDSASLRYSSSYKLGYCSISECTPTSISMDSTKDV
jgi:hypothetical protein